MEKIETPPVLGCEASSSRSVSEYWINPENFHWMIGDIDTGIDSRGTPGMTPMPNEETGTWWIGNYDTGLSYLQEPYSPQSDTDIFE